MTELPSRFSGLDLLATAVVVLDGSMRVLHLNPAAESLFTASDRNVRDHLLGDLFADAGEFGAKLRQTLVEGRGFVDPDLVLARPGQEALHLNCIVTPVE